MRFENRSGAGRQLAEKLLRYRSAHPIVLALARGGVPVGYEVARALDAPLDVVLVRKLGAPGQPELGIGAVVDGDHPVSFFNDELVQALGISQRFVEREIAAELEEIHRRQRRYRGERAPPELKGRTAIVVDDGIATGGSVRAVLRAVRDAGPKRVVLAVPVAPRDTVESLRGEVDDLVCLDAPAVFYAVGQYYEDFEQVSDGEVVRLLEGARRGGAARQPVSSEGRRNAR
jgi:putative phosphoribosyl transferase